MKRNKQPISYGELALCVIIITGTFQTLYYLIFSNDLINDSYGFLRFLLIGIFASLHYASFITFNSVYKTFRALWGLLVIYLIMVFIFNQGVKALDSALKNDYIEKQVEKKVENSRNEMASRGFLLNEKGLRQMEAEQIQKSLQLNILLRGLAYKLLFAALFSLMVASLAKKEKYQQGRV